MNAQDTNLLIKNTGTLFEDFETIGDWTVSGTGASQAVDTTYYRTGTQGLKLSATGGNYARSIKTINQNFSAIDIFTFWFYLHDQPNTANVTIQFSSTAVALPTQFMYINFSQTYFRPGWNQVNTCKSDFTSQNEESWSNTMVRLRFYATPDAGQDIDITFDELRCGIEASTRVIFVWDDGRDTTYTKAYPILNGNNQVGCDANNTDNIGGANKMTLSQLTEIYNAGWDICNHSKTHPVDLTGLNAAELDTEVNDAYDYLMANGFSRSAKIFVYPGGPYNDTIITEVANNHVLGRTTGTLAGTHQWHFDLNDDNQQYKIKCHSMEAAVSLATIETAVDFAISRKGLLVIMGHGIIDADAADLEWLTEDLQSLSDYLKTKEDAGLLKVIAFSEYYDEAFIPDLITTSPSNYLKYLRSYYG